MVVCPTCQLTFASVTAFGRHRVYNAEISPCWDKWCLSEFGMEEIGMVCALVPGAEGVSPVWDVPALHCFEPVTQERLRLRMKVWTDDQGKRYLMPTAFADNKPFTPQSFMTAYGMRDEGNRLVHLSGAEWNSLPFFYFIEDGECSLEERPQCPGDVISVGR